MTIRSFLRPSEIFYGHLVYFMVIWYSFPRFWYFGPRKIWQPWCQMFLIGGCILRHAFRGIYTNNEILVASCRATTVGVSSKRTDKKFIVRVNRPLNVEKAFFSSVWKNNKYRYINVNSEQCHIRKCHFCWAKLNHRTLLSPPPKKNGNECQLCTGKRARFFRTFL
jgi:hypothetical protein